MTAVLRVFVRSFLIPGSRDALDIAYDYHYLWQGRGYHHIYRSWMGKIYSKGRFLDQESFAILEALPENPGKFPYPVRLIDVSTLPGLAQAVANGIWKTPAIALGKKKCFGRAAILDFLLSHLHQPGY